jgi:hypothetical protein
MGQHFTTFGIIPRTSNLIVDSDLNLKPYNFTAENIGNYLPLPASVYATQLNARDTVNANWLYARNIVDACWVGEPFTHFAFFADKYKTSFKSPHRYVRNTPDSFEAIALQETVLNSIISPAPVSPVAAGSFVNTNHLIGVIGKVAIRVTYYSRNGHQAYLSGKNITKNTAFNIALPATSTTTTTDFELAVAEGDYINFTYSGDGSADNNSLNKVEIIGYEFTTWYVPPAARARGLLAVKNTPDIAKYNAAIEESWKHESGEVEE